MLRRDATVHTATSGRPAVTSSSFFYFCGPKSYWKANKNESLPIILLRGWVTGQCNETDRKDQSSDGTRSA